MKERNGYLFVGEQREKKLAQFTGPLDRLAAMVDWGGLAQAVNEATGREGERPQGGRPPYPTEAMLKIVVLQQLYGGMSDEQMEYCLLDRMSWQRFVGLAGHRHLPDARTIWKFKELLAKGNEEGSGAHALFDIVHAQIARAGYQASGGQIVDATFVTVPKTSVNEEDRKSLNEGKTPDHWTAKEAAHKDTDARWAIKGKNAFYGYKAHVNVDQKHKLIRAIEITAANVDDREPFEGLLDTSEERLQRGKTAHADRGYHGQAQRDMLKANGLVDGIARKDDPNKFDQSDIHERNKALSKIRARVEHVFGDIHQSSGKTLRCIGLNRATAQSILKATVYNLRRWMVIDRRGACFA
jgi:IS5 family transposase